MTASGREVCSEAQNGIVALPAEAAPRPDAEEYSAILSRLQQAVREACDPEEKWQARVAAGINATVEFAVADPVGAGALTLEAHADTAGSPDRYLDAVDYFSKLLGNVAPRGERLPASTDEALVGGIATMVAVHLRSGTIDHLVAFVPELVYLALLPYAGYDRARYWADQVCVD